MLSFRHFPLENAFSQTLSHKYAFLHYRHFFHNDAFLRILFSKENHIFKLFYSKLLLARKHFCSKEAAFLQMYTSPAPRMFSFNKKPSYLIVSCSFLFTTTTLYSLKTCNPFFTHPFSGEGKLEYTSSHSTRSGILFCTVMEAYTTNCIC